MAVKLGNVLANGQSKNLRRPWVENAGKVVLQQDPKGLAEVKNLTLGLLHPGTGQGNFFFRWRITYGLGGAVNVFLCDAAPLQQLSLSADRLSVEVLMTSLGPNSGVLFSCDQNQEVTATAFFGQGNTATSQPTFSQVVEVPNGVVGIEVPIPAGAVAARLGGAFIDVANAADISLIYFTESGIQWDAYTGTMFAASVGAFVPLGPAASVVVSNGGGAPVQGMIQFALDF